MEPDEADPEKFALLSVQQWLHEQGYLEALTALERSTGLQYDDSKLHQGSQLMKIVWNYMEQKLAVEEEEAAQLRRKEDEQWIQRSSSSYASQRHAQITDLHGSNVITVRFVPDKDQLLTGAGDGHVRCIGLDGALLWCSPAGGGAVLCLECGTENSNPSKSSSVAVGSMDGSVSVLDLNTGDLLASCRPHSKYVVRVVWLEGGEEGKRRLVSVAWDGAVALLQLTAAEAGWQLQEEKKVSFPTAVQDVVRLHSINWGSAAGTLVVALRDTNLLRLLDADTLEPSGCVNMNALGDQHVSFWARHLALSPNGRYLLVSTDTPRMLLLRTLDWSQARDLYDYSVQKFHQPAAAWHADGSHVYVASAGGKVLVYHIGSTKVVATLAAHEGTVRDVTFSASRNMLATCGYDKAVSLFV